MTEVILLACLTVPVVLALQRPRLWPALLIAVALANLLVFGGNARFYLDDVPVLGTVIARGLGLVCGALAVFLLIRPQLSCASASVPVLAMTLPAGLLALWLGTVLSGAPQPLAIHLGIVAACLICAALGFRLTAPWRGAALGLALWLVLVTLDSMRFGATLTNATPASGCLVFGGGPPTGPVMALTVAKPVSWLGQDGQWLRWSFRSRAFVWGSGEVKPVCPS
ncbi:MAG: hypothetical protein MUE52_12675 [Tabrizicola sp.]|jgi:hypothetical protein|nr:hypothetical protein [Tabrizicola sp.]